jgi:site-specific recombinase XerD
MNTLIEQFRKELIDVALYRDDTVATYITCIYQFVAFMKKNRSSDPVHATASQLKQWMMQVKNTGISNSRLSHYKCALTAFMTFLVKMNRIDVSPADALFPMRKTKSERNQPIDRDTACKLLKSVNRSSWIGERDFMIISCLYALGLRRQELVTLKVRDFDPNFDAPNKIGLLTVHGKARKQRALFVVDKLYDKLVAYLNRPVAKTHVNVKCNLKYRPIFPSRYGATLTGDHIWRIVTEAATKAGITQRVTPHVLRHSFATEMYQRNTPLEDIEDIMGHETEAETALYIHVPEPMKKQALELISLQGEYSWPYRQGGASQLTS